MGRDRSLDEFLDAGGAAGDGRDSSDEETFGPTTDGSATEPDGAGSDAGEDDATDDRENADDGENADDDGVAGAAGELDVRPAEITMAHAPDGAACEVCGERVERRWRDGDGLVCTDCKAW